LSVAESLSRTGVLPQLVNVIVCRADQRARDGHRRDRGLQVEDPADLEVALLDHAAGRVEGGDRADAERQRPVRRAGLGGGVRTTTALASSPG
jgi:hypothetical protein